jgi:hypothetical protein
MNTQATTRRAIAAQMKENTGASILDSGGAYGRNHERNQSKGVKFGQGLQVDEYSATIPVQDYMEHCFARTPDAVALEKVLKAHIRRAYPGEGVALGYHEGAAINEALEAIGATMDGEHSGKWWNTYNDDTDLSQTLQLLTFAHGGKDYAIVQVHGGCDVRGGYTNGKVYEVPEFYNLFDVKAEPEHHDGTGQVSFYDAQEKHGMKWNDEAKRHEWPNGEGVYFYAPALEG